MYPAATKPAPIESEKPAGPVVQHGNSSGSGAQKDAEPSSVTTLVTAEAPMSHATSKWILKSWTQRRESEPKQSGVLRSVLEASDDVFDPPSGWKRPDSSEITGGTASDDDDVPPEARQELNRLKTLGTTCQASSADRLVPKRDVHSQEEVQRGA